MRAVVWAGGALFVVALAFTAWTYIVSFGTASPFTGLSAIAIDVLLFSLFAAHHSLFARSGAKRAMQRVVPDALLRSTYVWIASALLILACAVWRRIGGVTYSVASPAAFALTIVQLAGVVLTISGVRAIDPLELAGIHPPRADTDLQVRGAYALVRHPLYLGWMLMVFATPLMTGDRLTFAIVTSVYLLVAIPWEERSLEAAFGDDYRNYKRQVRWRVLPFVY